MDDYGGSNDTYTYNQGMPRLSNLNDKRPMSLMQSPLKNSRKSYKLPPKQNHIAAKGQVIINSLDTDKIVFA